MSKKPKVVKDDKKQKKKAPTWFYFVLVAIPFVFFVLLEVFLRIINYGTDFTTFKQISSYYPDKLFLNTKLPDKYFGGLANTPTVIPDGFDKIKKDNAFRVFVVGGSSTEGWPYVPNGSFSRQLKRRLELLYPSSTIEVINCGISAINSYTVRDFIPGILNQQPDLVLIYMGHNEYYGALGVGSSVSIGSSRFLINSYLSLKDYKTTQLLENILRWVYGIFKSKEDNGNPEKAETLMSKMIGESLIPLNSDLYYKGIDQFKGNLEDILQMIKNAKVPVILGNLTCNTLDLKPFVSETIDNLPSADSIYYLGKKMLTKGKIHKADSLLTFAKDLDALRFRAPTGINKVIEDLGKKYGIPVINIDSVFRSKSKYGITGSNLIVDHLHPNIEGYGLMAKSFFIIMKKTGNLPKQKSLNITSSQQDSILSAKFPFTMLDSTIAEMKAIQLTGAYPFVPKGTPNYRKINYQIKDLIDSLSVEVINHDTKWEIAHSKLGDRYFNKGNYSKFIKEMDAVIQERPYYDKSYAYLVSKLVDKNKVDDALPYLLKLDKIKRSYFSTKWLGQIYVYKGKNREALIYLQKAVKYPEADSQTWYNLAGAYYNNNQIDECFNALSKCLNLNPNNKPARKFYLQLKSLQK